MKARLPKGMGGGPQNMVTMIKQAHKMQEEMEAKKAEIEARDFTSTVGGGAVEVVMSGKKEIKSLNIKPEVVDPEDIEMLQDLIIAAVNEVIRTVETTMQEEIDKATNGISIPGLL